MDPTIQACVLGSNEFGEYPQFYSSLNHDVKIKVKIIKSNKDKVFPSVYIEEELYEKLDKIKSSYGSNKFLEARNATNPFEQLGLSRFFDRASVKLANIDFIFNLTSHQVVDENQNIIEISASFSGLIAPQSMDVFTFCDIAGGPGGWTQYLQYRRVGGMGLGITLKDKSLSWNEHVIDMDRFKYTYGEDGTGNLYTNSNYFIKYVLDVNPGGVNLACADGGFNVKGNEELQETVSTRLILCECYIATRVVKDNYHFVCKLFDTVTQFMADLIYCMSICFKEIYIFKPLSSRPANSERYLVCKYLIPDKREDIAQVLEKVYMTYTENDYVLKIFESLPGDFEEWLTELNNLSFKNQINVGENILKYINKEPVDIPTYNLYKALILWNIPDNVDKIIDKPVYVRRYKGNGYLPRTSQKVFNFNNTASEYRMKIGKTSNNVRCKATLV
jgi:cap1 methyltransferase